MRCYFGSSRVRLLLTNLPSFCQLLISGGKPLLSFQRPCSDGAVLARWQLRCILCCRWAGSHRESPFY
jgi:hypothetical protein